MCLWRTFLIILFLVLLTTPAYLKEEVGKENTSPLGFKLGSSRNEAIEVIKSKGNKIVKNTVDSKEIRTIVMEGAIVELPFDNNGADLQTSLEFYDDELMSSSLIFKSDDPSKQEELEAELSKYLIGLYGEPGEKEKVLGFTTWTWHVPDLKVVFSTNPNNNVAKVRYIYEPLNQSRVEEEIKRKQKEKPTEPAKEMFLEGNYSVPKHLKE
jgi:hypothetical protein